MRDTPLCQIIDTSESKPMEYGTRTVLEMLDGIRMTARCRCRRRSQSRIAMSWLAEHREKRRGLERKSVNKQGIKPSRTQQLQVAFLPPNSHRSMANGKTNHPEHPSSVQQSTVLRGIEIRPHQLANYRIKKYDLDRRPMGPQDSNPLADVHVDSLMDGAG